VRLCLRHWQPGGQWGEMRMGRAHGVPRPFKSDAVASSISPYHERLHHARCTDRLRGFGSRIIASAVAQQLHFAEVSSPGAHDRHQKIVCQDA
jgi:hypothetical protein